MIKIIRWPNHQIRELTTTNDKDQHHDTNGPALQGWHDSGHESFRGYYINGKLHRLDGPAWQSWYEDGSREQKEYWIDGQMISKEKFIAEVARFNMVDVICDDQTIKMSRESARALGLIA